ncbi:hypothetical protein GUJ93_ZPchr0002g26778 [Zizania palustris]|uniref:Uncharacterized protein n=1 Tax=Zizania palustris TaxID=103762 RepID=A0A8J5RCK6_ZIZPA|nr:hypothetical protein GUJ93_ZPchr0002g26778 [Zizania palustris]
MERWRDGEQEYTEDGGARRRKVAGDELGAAGRPNRGGARGQWGTARMVRRTAMAEAVTSGGKARLEAETEAAVSFGAGQSLARVMSDCENGTGGGGLLTVPLASLRRRSPESGKTALAALAQSPLPSRDAATASKPGSSV